MPRSTYCWMLAHPEAEPGPDPIEQDVVDAFESNRREHGAPRIKRGLAKKGVIASRRRITRIMKAKGPVSSRTKAKPKPGRQKADGALLPDIPNRRFDGYAPHTRIVSDLAYVRIGPRWGYACLLLDLCSREIVGHACGERKGNSCDNAAIESMNKTLKTASIYQRGYSSIDELRPEVDSYVRWYDNERVPSTLGYMSPV